MSIHNIPPSNKDIPEPIIVKNLLVDKLAITVDIPTNERDGVINRMREHGAIHRKSGGRYQYLLTLSVNKESLQQSWVDKSGDTTLRIEADPRGAGHNFMRFAWNPSKACPIATVHTIEHFIPSLWQYHDVLMKARVNRIDLAIDVLNVGIDQIYFHSAKKSMTEMIFTHSSAKGGKTEYLGQHKSEKRFRIYDKAAQIKQKNKKKIVELKEEIPEQNITRIELELKPNKKTSLMMLLDIESPFTDLSVCSYPEDLSDDDLFEQILARARYEGLTKALKALSAINRKKYLAILESSRVCWWDPIKTWGQMPNVIDELMYPIENTIEYKEALL